MGFAEAAGAPRFPVSRAGEVAAGMCAGRRSVFYLRPGIDFATRQLAA
jgi:hypothetical protein